MPRVLVIAALLCAVTAATAEILSSKTHNYSVETPTGWTRETPKPSWEKDGIVDGARRMLEKLYDGKPAKGQAAQMHLSVLAAPAGKTLAELAADPLQRELLMRIFGAPEQWPAVETEETVIKGENGDAKALRLIAKGSSMNLQGDAGPCRALMLMTLVKKKFYRLRLVAWTTQHDDEGLGSDLDSIDINFQLLDVQEEKVKGPRPDAPDADGKGPDGAEDGPAEGDAGEEKVVEDDLQGWRFVKPKKLATREIDKETYPYVVSMLGANDRDGSVDITLSAYPNGLIVNGQQVPDQDIRKWMTTSWWQLLQANHPDGPLETFDWPPFRPTASFLTLPKFDKPFMIAETPKKRDPEPSTGDIEKKFRMVESVKGKLGKEKAGEAWRGVCKGNRPRVGPEITLRYAWRTPKLTYMLNISLARDALPRYGPPVEQFLASFELTK